MSMPLETRRLTFRPLAWSDLPFFTALHADPAVARYLISGKPRTEAETRAWLETEMRWYAEDGAGHLGAVLKSDGRLIGRCGLQCFEIEVDAERPRAWFGPGSAPPGVKTMPMIEVGYTFHPEVWGQGLATEAARFMREQGFARGEPRIIAVIHPENQASIRVAEKTGLTHRSDLEFVGRTFRRYEISREAWERTSREAAR
ncbi:MAG TPA: GNAT family N-acetyltransferase [Myxococcaceae bacterium]|jgi:ribosomal-protein-alanine N-acetyltransferase